MQKQAEISRNLHNKIRTSVFLKSFKKSKSVKLCLQNKFMCRFLFYSAYYVNLHIITTENKGYDVKELNFYLFTISIAIFNLWSVCLLRNRGLVVRFLSCLWQVLVWPTRNYFLSRLTIVHMRISFVKFCHWDSGAFIVKLLTLQYYRFFVTGECVNK